jgi:hypothetical protein
MTCDIPWRYCRNCHSQRRGLNCQKCGNETIVPCAGWENPELPPVDRIRKLARQVGYAIGEHGTKERDLDLIAVPWTEDAVDIETFLQHLCENLVYQGKRAQVMAREEKPLGRYAVNIDLFGYFKLIDLSICPRIKESENK